MRSMHFPFFHRASPVERWWTWWKKQRRKHRLASTLMELILVIGIFGVLSAVTIVAIAPRRVFVSARDAGRIANAGHIQNAMYQYLIDNWELPAASTVPDGEENAKPICQRGGEDPSCVNLDPLLVPEYIAYLPVDDVEPCALYTGYATFALFDRPRVISLYKGLLPGDIPQTPCPQPDLEPIYTLDDGESGFTPQGGWPGGNTPEGFKGDYVYRDATSGNQHARWTFALPSPGTYTVYSSWVAFDQNATTALYVVYDGNEEIDSVVRNQQVAPSDGQYDGVLWGKLGTYTFDTATGEVRLYANATGRIVADGLMILPGS